MTTYIYGTFDTNARGPGLELEDGNLVVSCGLSSSDIHRLVRGNIPTTVAGDYFFEVAFYGDGLLLDQVAVGIVQPTHGLSKYPGEQSTGYGFKVGNGNIYSNNVSVATVDDAATEIYIGIALNTAQDKMTLYVDGTPVTTITVASGTYYPAVTVSGTEAYNMRCYINCGQRAFGRPIAGLRGWFATVADPAAIYLCPVGSSFNTRYTDSLQAAVFQPRILNPESFSVSRTCGVWLWDSMLGASSTTYSSVDIDNQDGVYDYLLSQDWRDQPATLYAVLEDDSFDNAEVIASPIVDTIRAVDERVIRVTFKGRLTQLEKPLQQRIIPPWADEGAAGRPVPIMLGACRNVSPILENEVDRRYLLHDAAVTNIAAVRDKGARLDPYTTPAQYRPSDDLQALLLEVLPDGLLTIDASSRGSQVSIPGADDVFEGDATMTAWAVSTNPPDGYTFNGGTGNSCTRRGTAQGYAQDYVALVSTDKTYYPDTSKFGAYLRFDTFELEPGRTYEVSFNLVYVTGSPPPVANGFEFGVMLRTDLTTSPLGAITPNQLPIKAALPATQKYTFVYTVPQGSTRKVYIIVAASTSATPGTAHGTCTAVVYGLQARLLGQVTQSLPLEGISLEDYQREILENRAKLSSAAWSATDCAEIDSATKYKFGVEIADPMTIARAARMPLNSFCATMYEDRNGVIRFARLLDPSLEPDGAIVASFDETNIMFGVSVFPDVARGLTTSIGARKNWHVFSDSDFVSDYLEVPAAIRTQWKRSHQFIVNAAGTPSPMYAFAATAPPLDSLLDLASEAQTEISRVVAPYMAGRRDKQAPGGYLGPPRFIRFRALFSGIAPPELKFGSIILVTYPRFGLTSGQKFAVKDVAYNVYEQFVDIVAWGSR